MPAGAYLGERGSHVHLELRTGATKAGFGQGCSWDGVTIEGDVLICFSTSGNSANILRALESGRSRGLITAAFLGKDGGMAKSHCDIPFIVPANAPHRIQEGHKILYHTLCEWVDEKVEGQEARSEGQENSNSRT